jgi:hypothetical protein
LRKKAIYPELKLSSAQIRNTHASKVINRIGVNKDVGQNISLGISKTETTIEESSKCKRL